MRVVAILIVIFLSLAPRLVGAQSLPQSVLEQKNNGECYQVRDYLTSNGLSLFQYRSCIANHRTKFIEQALLNLDCETIENLVVPDEGLSSLFECRANVASTSGNFNSHWRSYSDQRRLRVENMISREEFIRRAELIQLKAQKTENVELIEYSELHFEEFTRGTSRALARIEEERDSLQTDVVQTTSSHDLDISGAVKSGDGELNLRAGPSTNTEILEVLRNGQTVTPPSVIVTDLDLTQEIPAVEASEDTYVVIEIPDYGFSSFLRVEVGDTIELIEVTEPDYGLVSIQTSDGRTGTFQLNYLRKVGAAPSNGPPSIDGEPLFVCNTNADETVVMSQSNLSGRTIANLANNFPVFAINSIDNADGTRVFEINFLDTRGQNIVSGFIRNGAVRRECSIQGSVADLRGPFELASGYCHFVVASRQTEIDAARYVDRESNFSPESHSVYQSRNGWYAISIGEVLEANFETLRAERDVPEDSFCTSGESFLAKSREFCQKSEIMCQAGYDVSYGNCEVQAAIDAINYLEISSSTVSENGYVSVEGSFCGVLDGFAPEDLELTSFIGRGAEDHKY